MVATTGAAPTLGIREGQRLQTRERLFVAALDEIRRHGTAAGKVDRIVAAVGVSRGTFYVHFPTKEDVLFEWGRRRQAEIVAALERAIRKPRTLRAALLEIVGFLANLAASPDGRLVREILALNVRSELDPANYPMLDEIECLLAAAGERGELRRGVDARAGAVLFLSNVFGFLVNRTTSIPHFSAEILVDVFLTGAMASARRDRRHVGTTTKLTDRRERPRRKRR